VLDEVDKVLWAEKLLAIAQHLDQHLWLTDLYLTEAKQQAAHESIISKKLVFEGAALPSSEGHIVRIANYMNRLLNDSEQFMQDFSEISFDGSTIDESEPGNPLVRFRLVAWYDAAKRIEHQATKKKPPASISQLQSTLKQRDHNIDELTERAH
jgi:hypothetical protein